MSNRDPFSEKANLYGRQRPGSEPTASEASSAPVTSGFPQKPVQGGTVPLPTRPSLPNPPVERTPSERTPAEFPAAPTFVPPTFREKSNIPSRGSSDDLFPTQAPTFNENEEDDESYFEEEEAEETVAEAYEELYGEPLVGSEEDYLPLTPAEEDLYEKRMVAADLDAAMPSLYSLAADPDVETRVEVASNPSTPLVLLERLAKDPEADVRESVMENENCPIQLYKSFVLDPDDFVVASWLANERTTSDMVVPLHNTKNAFIAHQLVETTLVSDLVKARLQQLLR